MINFLLVGLGGAIGAVGRYGIGRLMGPMGFPFPTLVANILGGLLMGLLAGWLAARGGGEQLRLLLGVGLLGGFTTFSAFSLEVMLMLECGEMAHALGYVLASVILSIAALALGLMIARWAFA